MRRRDAEKRFGVLLLMACCTRGSKESCHGVNVKPRDCKRSGVLSRYDYIAPRCILATRLRNVLMRCLPFVSGRLFFSFHDCAAKGVVGGGDGSSSRATLGRGDNWFRRFKGAASYRSESPPYQEIGVTAPWALSVRLQPSGGMNSCVFLPVPPILFVSTLPPSSSPSSSS